ncbi:gliding motility-associated C-terminal domain-containing protein [Epilithonimonas sp.]|uniref:T9SS type B sorting domain-containing protein n=1 Tax=Epilithonimonas sp. TaxID=2894511 RepID=UPI00289DBE1B|nr:gliding motility-associated C-terminal domain-containing protein [Epilithonimonas sp.]
MDTEHWFAPMFDTFNYSTPGYDNSLNGDFLYLSTDSVDDFEVVVYSGEVEINRVTIRKGSPKYIKLAPKVITTLDASDTFLIAKRGLHLIGSRKFFANLRLLRGPHAEIINSKGFAGLGTDFYAMMTPLSVQQANLSSQVNILATENNTSVKISGYNPNIKFQNGTQVPEINVKLNKGDSYMVSVPNRSPYVVDSTGLGDPDENYYGLIGANIRSDRPISVTNGSFNGTYVNSSGGNDILMDQTTPVNRLGKEYVIGKGNGPIRASNQGGIDSERVIVLSTKDGTKFTINDSPVVYTLDKGKYKIIYGSESYKMQAPDVYNMYIKSTEDIYVYQLLAGSALFDSASGGMNMIPALNCLLPNQIVELPEVNQIGTKDDFDTNVNIITRNGAQVTMNGEVLNGSYGPYPVSGTSEWVLFTKKNVKGNLSIYSTKAVTAGLAGGDKAVGYGGFFGGFSSVPQIIKTGTCTIGDTELKVDDGYDSYEWYYNGALIASGADLFFIDPENYGSGSYYCKISKSDCGSFTTDPYIYTKCPEFTTKSFDTGNCKIVEIPVAFSSDPLKPIDWDSVIVTEKPEGGSVDYDRSAHKIIFNPENTDLKTVTFTYYFEGTATIPDSEEVTVTVNIAQINLTNMEDVQCVDFDGNGVYDLKAIFEKTVNQDSTYVKYEYFEDLALTQKIPETNSANPYYQVESYKSEPGKSIYVKVTNIYGCDNIDKPAEIALKTFELPVINTIDVKDNTFVTISVTKGNSPYLYYIKKNGPLDYLPLDADYSSSSTLPVKDGKGSYTVYVKSADNCYPVVKTFFVVGISNIITPNGDGKNDTTDMSMLSYKINPKFQIFDRNGRKIFEGSTANDFIWTGKENGITISTGTYWYFLQWQDFENAEPDIMTGWIHLKNRSSN